MFSIQLCTFTSFKTIRGEVFNPTFVKKRAKKVLAERSDDFPPNMILLNNQAARLQCLTHDNQYIFSEYSTLQSLIHNIWFFNFQWLSHDIQSFNAWLMIFNIFAPPIVHFFSNDQWSGDVCWVSIKRDLKSFGNSKTFNDQPFLNVLPMILCFLVSQHTIQWIFSHTIMSFHQERFPVFRNIQNIHHSSQFFRSSLCLASFL